jgi:hypothetical protein
LLYGKSEIDGNYENIITPEDSFASVTQTLNGKGSLYIAFTVRLTLVLFSFIHEYKLVPALCTLLIN